MKYVFDVEYSPSLLRYNRPDSIPKKVLDDMLHGRSGNPSTEVIYMFLIQYGITPREYDFHYNKNWFKDEFKRRREECILC